MKWRGSTETRRIPPQTVYEMIGFPDHPDASEQIKEIIDSCGVSLYVGRTNNIGARVHEHNTSGCEGTGKEVWWDQIGLILTDHLPPGSTPTEAGRVERARILQRSPWFNIEDNRGRFRWDKYHEAQTRHAARLGQRRHRFAHLRARIRLAVDRVLAVLIPAAVGVLACVIAGAALVLNGTLTINH